MEKHKHLDLDARIAIEVGLKNRKSFKQIAREIGKDCSTVLKKYGIISTLLKQAATTGTSMTVNIGKTALLMAFAKTVLIQSMVTTAGLAANV